MRTGWTTRVIKAMLGVIAIQFSISYIGRLNHGTFEQAQAAKRNARQDYQDENDQITYPPSWIDNTPNKRKSGEYGGTKTVFFISKELERANVSAEVTRVFKDLGYNMNGSLDSELLWGSQNMIEENLVKMISTLKPHQRVSAIPGMSIIGYKTTLQTAKASYMPRTFIMPFERRELAEYYKDHKDTLWLEKRLTGHKGSAVKLADIPSILYSPRRTWLEYQIQELVHPPLLIDGFKVEISVYVAVTSVNPLRVYKEVNEYLVRICPEKYYPFDPVKFKKYINQQGTNYFFQEIYEMPSVERLYNEEKATNKEALYSYMRSKGYNVDKLEEDISFIISDVFTRFESDILKEGIRKTQGKLNTRNFFEMVRFDFVQDETGKLFLIEINRGPGQSAVERPMRRQQIERSLYTLLNLVDVARPMDNNFGRSEGFEKDRRVSDRQISTYSDTCNSDKCLLNCSHSDCELCLTCLTEVEKEDLYRAYLEHIQRYEWKRVVPRTFKTQDEALEWEPNKDADFHRLLPSTQKMAKWFRGKCLQSELWCN